jgi:hypothetical protein
VSRRKNSRPPLMVRVWAAMGSAGIIEDVTLKSDIKGERLEGLQAGRHIWVNPIWSETYVRRTTTFLLRRMTDAEVQTFYDEYQQRARRRKRRRKSDASGV